ncbi:S8 family serine peptidase [Bdellovibrio sp. 22V]|uniref:S8 family serine peptidase n=1 Tax=Bdellovibrio sp. 22V TaxID=3044166 RepID=UPI002543D993|nr:S8 family serine peptidase [Bdellovibrio sp. 22V]WII71715.1 S8 family serine peptidase [Bdellovibrio sp. 22V]
MRFISFLVITSLLAAGCTPSPKNDLGNQSFLDGLFVTRPTVEEPMIAILKLQTPALLEMAERKDGRLTINPKLLKVILAEQEETIAALQEISPKIRVLIRYKLVLNGLAIWAPADVYEEIQKIPNVVMAEKPGTFARPALAETKAVVPVGENTSVKFIGSEEAYKQNIRGQGMKVGIIDTGIDYTHKMFLGEGTEEAYKNNDPRQANAAFPNKKVVGGIDLVGSDYHSGSLNFEKRIPVPDANPLDESGHGTHVAGTVAGFGDGVNTYDGVAPAADLYAIKVFGAKGSTSDEVVIAALEYAIDPTGDLTFKDQLDVVNLSLGSGYGNPHIMYNHAIRNTVRGGTIVVASGGNSGDKPYIVGAPGVSDDAISVASSVDNMNQNVQFPAVEFTGSAGTTTTEYVEAAITKTLATIPALQGEIIHLGVADKDFDSALKEKIKGKVAFIDRGVVAFADKIRRAQDGGAIAVVVANNDNEPPFIMGGDGAFDIPAVMISKKVGDSLKAQLKAGPVTVDLKSQAVIEKPWLVDTISNFSSRGPRSEDGMIKPEIAAPGSNIISASVGGGDKGESMSGTSMAGPHIAGVMALLKQKYTDLDPYELKSVLLGHGKVIADAEQKTYTVSRQGAGRVQVGASLTAQVVAIPSTLSFGITDVEKQKTLNKTITLKNIGTEALTLTPVWKGSQALKVSAAAVTLAPGEAKSVVVTAKINATLMASANDELDGFFTFIANDKQMIQLPALVVARQISQIKATALTVFSTSEADAAGSAAELKLENKGLNKGPAYLFNLLALDTRKKETKPDLVHNRNCDMQSAGYRVLEKDGVRKLQVAVKLYEGMTTWDTCEVNVQIDADKDGVTDQEIAGLTQESLAGHKGSQFVSLLLDGATARALRQQYEKDYVINPDKAEENYTPALIDEQEMHVFDNSTLAIIEADISLLALADTGELNIKVSTTHQDNGAIEYDDYLAGQDKEWKKISLRSEAQSFTDLPEMIELQGRDSVVVPLTKGYGTGDLILYAPQNKSVRDVLLEDAQSQIVPVIYSSDEN